jgi:hypothetical protein
MQGILARIFLQRGCLKDCEDVLDVQLEILTRFKCSSEGASSATVSAAVLET